jgi:hypothetical protein
MYSDFVKPRPHLPRPTILRGEGSRDNNGRAEHEDDRKSRGTAPDQSTKLYSDRVLIAVSIITVWTLYMVPSWQVPGDPFPLAAVVGAVTVACLWLARWLGSRAMKFERTMLAGFLVAMPLVYVMGWFSARDHAASSWIWVELRGLALFAAFAALGLKNSPWFLAIGIAGQSCCKSVLRLGVPGWQSFGDS